MSADLQNKLFNYEESPPDGAWAALSAALDDQLSPTLARKLQQVEAAPPPAAWSRIEQALSAPAAEQAPVVPFFRRYARPLRYTGAIAVFVFAAIIVSLTISKKTISETTAPLTAGRPPVRIRTAEASMIPQPRSAGQQTNSLIALRPQAAVSSTPYKGRRLNLSYGRYLAPMQTHTLPSAPSFIPNAPSAADPIVDGRMDQYIVYTDEQGNVMRVPKKLFDAIACPAHSADCREKLHRLQTRMASAAMNPGFNGVLDLVNHLNENQ